MTGNNILIENAETKTDCLEMFKILTNKDELSPSCKKLMEKITANDKGVMENHPLGVGGGRRWRNSDSHAVLQRRYTGKMSGEHLSV